MENAPVLFMDIFLIKTSIIYPRISTAKFLRPACRIGAAEVIAESAEKAVSKAVYFPPSKLSASQISSQSVLRKHDQRVNDLIFP